MGEEPGEFVSEKSTEGSNRNAYQLLNTFKSNIIHKHTIYLFTARASVFGKKKKNQEILCEVT